MARIAVTTVIKNNTTSKTRIRAIAVSESAENVVDADDDDNVFHTHAVQEYKQALFLEDVCRLLRIFGLLHQSIMLRKNSTEQDRRKQERSCFKN